MKLLLTIFLSFLTITCFPTIANGCFEVERDALLTFKAGLNDPGKLLSSWHGPNCCNWTGVVCDNITNHVLMLNLRNPLSWADDNWKSHVLTGSRLNPTLLSLRHLTHFDISGHDFSNSTIPKFIGSFQKLVYLNLSFSLFQGALPHELGNLSRLQFLDLSESNFTGLLPPQLGNLSDLRYLSLSDSYYYTKKPAHDRLSWLSHLSNLRFLDLSSIDIINKVDWSEINKMHLLETLILSSCFLHEIPTNLSHVNLTSLTKLDISFNLFNVMLPNWFWNLTSLVYIDLRSSGFHGNIPDTLSNLTGLVYIDLSSNGFHGSIPSTLSNLVSLNFLALGCNDFENVHLEPIGKLPNLRSLDLSWLGIKGDFVNLIKRSCYMWYNLESIM